VDNDILEQIYHRYAGQVYLYLFSLCHSHALAEDLMQETFLKALCSMELSQDAVLPWLLRVAKNLYIEASYRSKERAEVVRRRTLKLSNTQGAEQTSLSGDTGA
jgi:DNA-directed RNA polymerase specialized sigma24 family protein